MNDLPPVMPLRRPEVLVADFDTELVVLVPADRQAHHLDEGLSLVLDSCDGVTPTSALVDEVVQATGQSTDQVRVWLGDAIERLIHIGVVEPFSDQWGRPTRRLESVGSEEES
jgi:hypothetical protein